MIVWKVFACSPTICQWPSSDRSQKSLCFKVGRRRIANIKQKWNPFEVWNQFVSKDPLDITTTTTAEFYCRPGGNYHISQLFRVNKFENFMAKSSIGWLTLGSSSRKSKTKVDFFGNWKKELQLFVPLFTARGRDLLVACMSSVLLPFQR